MAIHPRTKFIKATVAAVLAAGLGYYFAGGPGLLVGAVVGFPAGLMLAWILTPRWRGSGPVPPGHWR